MCSSPEAASMTEPSLSPKTKVSSLAQSPATGLSRRIPAAFVSSDAVTLGNVLGCEGAVPDPIECVDSFRFKPGVQTAPDFDAFGLLHLRRHGGGHEAANAIGDGGLHATRAVGQRERGSSTWPGTSRLGEFDRYRVWRRSTHTRQSVCRDAGGKADVDDRMLRALDLQVSRRKRSDRGRSPTNIELPVSPSPVIRRKLTCDKHDRFPVLCEHCACAA